MSAYKLFGDGIHDDTLAIQEQLDSGCSDVFFVPYDKSRLKVHHSADTSCAT
ncbi:MAG: hypothetical protein IJW03_00750 [Clostridia bacterium]|nr:hypothetical protein [Clostridia bacterium]